MGFPLWIAQQQRLFTTFSRTLSRLKPLCVYKAQSQIPAPAPFDVYSDHTSYDAIQKRHYCGRAGLFHSPNPNIANVPNQHRRSRWLSDKSNLIPDVSSVEEPKSECSTSRQNQHTIPNGTPPQIEGELPQIGEIPPPEVSQGTSDGSRTLDDSIYTDDDDNDDEDLDFAYDQDMFARDYPTGLVLLQPLSREHRGSNATKVDSHDIQEATRLVEGMGGGGFRIVDTIKVNRTDGPEFFGKGNLKRIAQALKTTRSRFSDDIQVNIVFVNVPVISGSQRAKLENLWSGFRVIDRFGIILQIFKTRAKSAESKLQVALAEIPYLRGQIVDSKAGGFDRQRGGTGTMSGSGEARSEHQRRLLKRREVSIRKRLLRINKQHEVLRQERQKKKIPVVALIGYTNAGKSALLKRLAETSDPEDTLSEDRYFHTLQTNACRGKLVDGMPIIVLDSIGLISDLPHGLVEAFKMMLSEIEHATVLVHVRDTSHPQTLQQNAEVHRVLESEMKLPKELLDSMVEVNNKADLLPSIPNNPDDANLCYVSATSGYGIDNLMARVSEAVLAATGKVVRKFRLSNYDPEQLSWFYQNTTVLGVEADDKGEFITLTARMGVSECRKHAKHFKT
eukprot:m.186086 g.186086  ORF g.186086 m.186086 type:complete len:619 (-) comp32254_c0_seq1:75-1931(-)